MCAGQQGGGAAIAEILAHLVMGDEARGNGDAPCRGHAAEAGLALGNEGQPGRAVEQRDTLVPQIGQKAGRRGEGTVIVDVVKGVGRAIDGAAVNDEREAAIPEQS